LPADCCKKVQAQRIKLFVIRDAAALIADASLTNLRELEQVRDVTPTYGGDAALLRLGIQAYALGIAFEFDPYFGLSISRVDPLPHQLEAVYDSVGLVGQSTEHFRKVTLTAEQLAALMVRARKSRVRRGRDRSCVRDARAATNCAPLIRKKIHQNILTILRMHVFFSQILF
jgi:hypothetical protein